MPRLKKRADGRYCRSIIDTTGKRKFFYGVSEREVEAKIREYEEAQNREVTFSRVADEWWDYTSERISPTSVRGYRVAYEKAKDFFGEYAIGDVNALDITRYLALLGNLNYAKKTVKNYKIVLNRILHHAVISGYISTSPARDAEIPRGLKQNRRTAAKPDDEDLIRKSVGVWLLPYTALMSGLRKGELLALQWKDIDFDKNVIHVTKSLYYANAPAIKSTKTEAGTRDVPILAPLREELVKVKDKPEHFVFSDTGEKPLSAKRFRTLLTHYQEQTGVTSTLHQLRKSFATAAARYGVPPKVLQSILGHKDFATTMNIYAEVRDESLQDAARLLERTDYMGKKKG